ncbi:hypothetical protein [Nocardia sp. NBC_00511]|uniref:hypothetical protein n=1 Tax=Nocardia sp. NBC_00511 TaxID=2903591 RepID=UPI002F913D50
MVAVSGDDGGLADHAWYTEVSAPVRTVATPITAIPQLAAAAITRGETDRVIRVEAADPPVIHTPGRYPNQWLLSGDFLCLPLPCPWCGWWRDGACQCPPGPPSSR